MRWVLLWDFTQHKILQECRFQQENYFFLCRTRRDKNKFNERDWYWKIFRWPIARVWIMLLMNVRDLWMLCIMLTMKTFIYLYLFWIKDITSIFYIVFMKQITCHQKCSNKNFPGHYIVYYFWQKYFVLIHLHQLKLYHMKLQPYHQPSFTVLAKMKEY
jgi:hypothetical protein